MKFYESIFAILEDIRQDILDQYEDRGLRASGDFDRLSFVGRRGRKVFLSLPFYSRFISKVKGRKAGRRPGAYPPPNVIEQWIRDKGLQLRDFTTGQFLGKTKSNYKRAAFLISRKIAEDGTDIYQGKRKPIDIDKVIDNRLDYRLESLADRILEDLRI